MKGTTIENCPKLELDKVLFSNGHIPAHVVRERRIVWNMFAYLLAAGWHVAKIDTGDERIAVRSTKAAMEVIFNYDDVRVFVQDSHGAQNWIVLVLGNDIDVISDYSIALDHLMTKFNAEDYA